MFERYLIINLITQLSELPFSPFLPSLCLPLLVVYLVNVYVYLHLCICIFALFPFPLFCVVPSRLSLPCAWRSHVNHSPLYLVPSTRFPLTLCLLICLCLCVCNCLCLCLCLCHCLPLLNLSIVNLRVCAPPMGIEFEPFVLISSLEANLLSLSPQSSISPLSLFPVHRPGSALDIRQGVH